MFRLIRLVVLVLVAFVVGLFFERSQQQTACSELGGTWQGTGVCVVGE